MTVTSPRTLEVETGPPAAGGGCVARADDGRVVFVRHALPGEVVVAAVTAETSSFLRADAVEVLRASPDRVDPPCPHAGPGRCGGCDWQHVALPAQRRLKAALVEEQLRRLAGEHRTVTVEAVAGDDEGLGWRTRVRFAVDREGRVGLHVHRSDAVEPVRHCLIAAPAVDAVGVGDHRWRGAGEVEVQASGSGGPPVVSVRTGRRRLHDRPPVAAGLVVDGRTERPPDRLEAEVLGHRFGVSAGVFWQVHPGAAATLARVVLEGLAPRPGDRVVDLYCGAGLFTVVLAAAVGRSGSVVGVERSRRACADARGNAAAHPQVAVRRAPVTGNVVAGLERPDLVVLDPSREGAGKEVMAALAGLRPAPRRIASVSCDPATFARDLRVLTDAGWTLAGLRAFDLFPMTEHVELVGLLDPPEGSDGG